MQTISVIIKRQEKPETSPYWEKFVIPYKKGYNVLSVLQAIQTNPINADKKKVAPPVWECNCMEEVCGACSMIINGKAMQACSALIDNLSQPIKLAPLSKFPVVKDLMVDRSLLFEDLKKVLAWINIDGYFDLGKGPRISQKKHVEMYKLSTCMTCGCCFEACPQVNNRSPFMGPSPLAQIVLFNDHPTGKSTSDERIKAAMSNEGIANCGNAQNCRKVCPKEIPLVDSLAKLQRQVIVKGIFGKLME